MIADEKKYLSFLAYCLDDNLQEVPNVGDMDWYELFKFSQDQAIIGIVLSGIVKITENTIIKLNIPKGLLYEWIGQANIIERRNKLINRRVQELTDFFKQQGKACCILKGQGNALMYPKPCLRTPGDIDIWLEGSKREIADFIHKKFPNVIVAYHHMEFPIFDDVEVEVHYLPSFSYNFIHNKRLQCFFKDNSEDQFDNLTSEGFAVPTKLFNLVFQLSHMMRHFFTQGIGLRHAIDYYYLLKQGLSYDEEFKLLKVLKRCGMLKFFSSILWIEEKYFGLDVQLSLIKSNKAGDMVLKEMLKGGNFGKQYTHHSANVLLNYLNQFIYNLQYVKEFPVEPISRPLALSCDYIKRHLLKMKY